ncbi:MAG TPA: cysteine dioxygenase family protein [Acidimicrobiales bacterium]|nr:cysteine dioxygenase family protein [Acidimicrobiales bacterium]
MSPRTDAPDSTDRAIDVASLATRLALAPSRWRPLVRHERAARVYVPIPDLECDAWVITWAPGTGLARHDHGGAEGAMAVLEGTLVERHGRTWAPATFRRRVLDTGSVVAFGADHIHDVRNEGVAPAISLHVYAPSLDSMHFYADDPRDDLTVDYRTAVDLGPEAGP